jgi:hypothetical protein
MKVEITQAPVAETEMLIRKPVLDVFEAFIDSRCHNQLLVHEEQWSTQGRS